MCGKAAKPCRTGCATSSTLSRCTKGAASPFAKRASRRKPGPTDPPYEKSRGGSRLPPGRGPLLQGCVGWRSCFRPVRLSFAGEGKHFRPTELSLPTAIAHPPTEAGRLAGLSSQAVAVWLFLCCGMIFVMVVIGGITRLTMSGLSITEWQPVTGILPPLSAAAWAAEFEKYQQIPQYRLINHGMTFSDFQTIYWWEYVHRLWGRLIGFAYAAPFVDFLARGRIPRRLTWPLIGIFALGAAQGALGWYMVESGLADRVEVSQYRLVAHLALALAIYAATLWIALSILMPDPRLAPVSSPHPSASRPPSPACGGGSRRRSAPISSLPRKRGRVGVG